MKSLSLLLCTLLVSAIGTVPVHAQTVATLDSAVQERDLSVLTRKNPSYDPLGVRFSSLLLHAGMDNTVQYTDNLYSSTGNEIDDILYKVSPFVTLRSDFARHALSASLSAQNGVYKDTSDENYTDYAASVSGAVDISDELRAPASVSYNRKHSKRSDPDDDDTLLEPTVYHELGVNGGLEYRGAYADVGINAALKNLDYRDNRTANAFINNADRNRNEMKVSANVGMSEGQRLSPFVYGGVEKIEYDNKTDDNGFERSSKGFFGGLGLKINPISSVLRGVLRAEHINRSYDDSRFNDTDDIIYAAEAVWEPSPLLALTFTGQNGIEESTLNDSSASVDRTLSASAYYELAPNIFLNPKISHLLKDYRGNSDRELKRLSGEFGMTYRLNRKIWFSGKYRHIDQKESGTQTNLRDFNNNVYNVSMRIQL